VFANPAARKRAAMTLRLSQDGGSTWPGGRWIHLGPSAYSDLALLSDTEFGLLYEHGERKLYEEIVFVRLSLGQLAASTIAR